jgi:hypothetical protein
MEVEGAMKVKADLRFLVQQAGLENAMRDFPEDVVAAAQTAAQLRNALSAFDNVAAEPWPPMRIRNAT